MEKLYLSKLLQIPVEEYSNWCICLNSDPGDVCHTLNPKHEQYNRLMEHISWKKSAAAKHSFRSLKINSYCLQFLGTSTNEKELWIFLGAFKVIGIEKRENGDELYQLEKTDLFSVYDERLILHYKKHQGDKQAKLPAEKIDSLVVHQILPKRFVSNDIEFPGYNNLSLSFSTLSEIINNKVDNWKRLLSNVQCIYAILDTKENKLYIGSTYGSEGIWQRWSKYVATHGHGGDVELKKIIKLDPSYAYKYFRFSVLECFFNASGNEQFILNRECVWKEMLGTRELGYNAN